MVPHRFIDPNHLALNFQPSTPNPETLIPHLQPLTSNSQPAGPVSAEALGALLAYQAESISPEEARAKTAANDSTILVSPRDILGFSPLKRILALIKFG